MLEQRPNCRDFVNRKRSRTADDPPEVSLSIFLDPMTLGSQLARAHNRQSVSDEFFWILERRIICSDFDLGENCYYVSRVSGLAQIILERLLQHVTDPTSRTGDKYTKWQWCNLATCLLVPDELVADLRPVAVNDDDAPSIENEIDDWAKTLARVPELVGDGRPLTRRRECVTTNGDDCRARRRHLRAGPIRAPRESKAAPNALRSAAASAARMRL